MLAPARPPALKYSQLSVVRTTERKYIVHIHTVSTSTGRGGDCERELRLRDLRCLADCRIAQQALVLYTGPLTVVAGGRRTLTTTNANVSPLSPSHLAMRAASMCTHAHSLARGGGFISTGLVSSCYFARICPSESRRATRVVHAYAEVR